MSGVDLRRQPEYRHVFQLRGGESLLVAYRDAQRVVDKRGPQADPETLWEITVNGVVRRVWMDEVADWHVEELTSAGWTRV